MRTKLRFSTGAPAAILTLEPNTNISNFLAEIKSIGKISPETNIEIRYGFPPKALELDGLESSTLDVLGINLDGEQLVVNVLDVGGGSGKEVETITIGTTTSSAVISGGGSRTSASKEPDPFQPPPTIAQPVSKAKSHLNPTSRSQTKKNTDPPTVLLKGRGTVVLRVMEDDNSCLFNAVSYVASSSQFSSYELRHFVASTIQSDLIEYNAGILGEDPDKYCQWITMETSWGGGIELKILASFFDLEIISMDVGTGHVYRFNEGKEKKKCIVIYSGIHYDALALSPPSDYYPGLMSSEPARDVTIFECDDDKIVETGIELVRKLKERHYHTDVQNFTLRCNICRAGFKGQKQAVEHAKRTGHTDFGEYE